MQRCGPDGDFQGGTHWGSWGETWPAGVACGRDAPHGKERFQSCSLGQDALPMPQFPHLQSGDLNPFPSGDGHEDWPAYAPQSGSDTCQRFNPVPVFSPSDLTSCKTLQIPEAPIITGEQPYKTGINKVNPLSTGSFPQPWVPRECPAPNSLGKASERRSEPVPSSSRLNEETTGNCPKDKI